MNWAILLMLVLLLMALGVLLLTRARQLRAVSGLPKGKVVYEDVSGLARQPLYARALGLAGKPDYLLRDAQGNLIPVEVKSSAAPRGERPYKSHLLQLAAYFVLVEETFDSPVPYGLIRYRNRTVEVANSRELRTQLLNVLAQMRRLLARDTAQRNHQQAQRCARCSMAHACDERLV